MTFPIRSVILVSVLMAFCVSALDAADASLPEGAVALFSFDEDTIAERGSLTVVSAAGSGGITAPIRGAETVRGVSGNALRFGDGEAIIDLGHPPSLTESKSISVSAWVRVREFRDSNYVVASEDWDAGHTRGFVLRLSGDGSADFTIGNGQWRTARGASVRSNRWAHLVGVADGAEVTIWVDGERTGRAPSGGGVEPSPFGVTIGRGNYDRGRGFAGDIDEVAIYDRPLTREEVTALHRHGKARRSLTRGVKDLDRAVVWPLSTGKAVARIANGLAVCTSRGGSAIVVVNRIEDLAIASLGRRGLGEPVAVDRPSASLEQGLVPQRIAAAMGPGGDVHVLASYLGFFESKPNFALHAVLDSRGRLQQEWSSVNEALGFEHIYRLPTLTTSEDGAVSLYAVGRTAEGGDVVVSAELSNKGIEKRQVARTDRVARQRIGDIARSIPFGTKTSQPLLLTEQGKDLVWVDVTKGEPSVCLADIRVPFESHYDYELHVGDKDQAHVAAQRPAGEIEFGDTTVDLATLVIASGKLRGRLQDAQTLEGAFPREADMIFAQSPAADVYLIAAVVDHSTGFDELFRLDIWRVSANELRRIGSAGRVGEAQRIAAAFASDDQLVVAVGGLDGAWATVVPVAR